MIHTAEQAGHDYEGKGKVGANEAAKFAAIIQGLKLSLHTLAEASGLMKACGDETYLTNTYYDTAAMPWLQ